MGQQQLLLIVLGVIIVGIAVVVGLQMFGTASSDANESAALQACLTIIADAQKWAAKPAMMGGGNGSFASMTPAKIGRNGTATGWTDSTTMDVFTIVSPTATNFGLTARVHGTGGRLITYTGIPLTGTTNLTPAFSD